MFDQTRITTGYNVEANLGASLLLQIVQGIYDGGKVTTELPLGNNITLKIGRPLRLTILEGNNQGNVELEFPIKTPLFEIEVGIGFSLKIVTAPHHTLVVQYSHLSEQTYEQIRQISPELVTIINEQLAKVLIFEQPLSTLTKLPIFAPQIRTILASDGYQPAIGLYTNFVEGSNPVSISHSKTFLSADRSFAVGIPTATISQVENKYRNQIVGTRGINAFQIQPFEGHIRILLKGKKSIPVLPDVHWSATITASPKVENGRLKIDTSADIDVDSGLWGDILGGVLGFFLGPLIGGDIGGIVTIEITEKIIGDVAGNKADHMIYSVLAELFAYIPYKIPVHSDPEFAIYITNMFTDIAVSTQGISIEGQSVSEQWHRSNECKELQGRIAGLEGEISSLQEQLPGETHHETREILREMGKLRNAITKAQDRMRTIGC